MGHSSRTHRAGRNGCFICYGLILLGLFSYAYFPSDAFRHFLISFAASNREDTVSIESVKPGIPFKLNFDKVNIMYRSLPGKGLQIDRASVSPDFLGFLSGRSGLVLNAEAYAGHISGNLEFEPVYRHERPVCACLAIEKVRIETCFFLQSILGRRITGDLKGSLFFKGYGNALSEGDGSFQVILGNGSYQLQEKMLGLEKIDFTTGELRLTLRKGNITIETMSLSGPRMIWDLSGSIALNSDIGKSRIDLKGNFKSNQPQYQKYHVTINGTLENPSMKFI